MVAMGLGSTAGISAGSGTDTGTAAHPSGGGGEIVGIEVIDLETGSRSYYEDWSDFAPEELPDGDYEIIEVLSDEDRVTERRHDIQTDGITTTSTDGVDLRVLVETETSYGVLDPDGEARVWVGAVDTADGMDRGPVPNHTVEVILEYREDWEWHEIESKEATTGEGGFDIVEFDLSESDHMEYRIVAESEDTDATATEQFEAGPYVGVPFHWTGMTPQEETDIGIFSAIGGIPETDVNREIEVSGPDDIEDSFDIEFEDGGIGWLSYTPEKPGDYRISSPESPEFGSSIGAAGPKALAPYFEIRDQYYDEEADTFRWGAFLLENTEPVADQDLTITVREDTFDDDPEEIITESVTTNDHGQFTLEIPRPEEEMDYEIEIETSDGEPVFLYGDGIRSNAIPPEAPVDPETVVDLDISFDTEEFQTWPGDEGTLELELTEDGAAVPNQPVTIWYSHTFNRLPMGKVEAQTDDDGRIEQDLTVPMGAPDGERFYIEAITELDGETYTDETSISIERYDVVYSNFGLERGDENAIPVSVHDRVDDEPVESMDITMFGNRHHVDTETFDADTTRTDENGEGELSLTIPEDVTNDIMVNELTPYRSTSISGGSIIDPLSADITVEPEEPARGETITVSYETDSDAAVSAFAVFPRRESADLKTLDEGDEATFSVPEYLIPGSSEGVHLLLMTEDGETASARESISIADELRASFSYRPPEPAVDETVTFEDASSAGPDAPIENREWDLSGDGDIDEEGEAVTYTYDEAGTYEVTLTITDEDGETDSVSETIEVGDPESPLAEYATDDDIIDTDGLRSGVDDWRGGDIDTETLREIVDYWRSGDSVTGS